MRLKLIIVFILYGSSIFALPAQKEVTYKKQSWFDITNVLRFNKKWGLMKQVSERINMGPKSQSQLVFRVMGLYNAGEKWVIGQSFAVFFNKKDDITVHELRLEQQFSNKQTFKNVSWLTITHRYRIGEKFLRKVSNGELAKGYDFRMRFRYRFGMDFTLARIGAKKNPLKFQVNDEILINVGKTIVYNIFNQNRLIGGFAYKICKGLTLSLAYMNLYAQKSSGNKYNMIHTFRFGLKHDFALKSKKEKRTND